MVEPWFRVEFVKPSIVFPHMLEVPQKTTIASIFIDGEWQRIASSREGISVRKLAGGQSVLVYLDFWAAAEEGHFVGEQVFHAGQVHSTRLPCVGSTSVSNDGSRIACLHYSAGNLVLRLLTPDGAVVSDDRAIVAGVVPIKCDPRHDIATVVGFTREGSPVICFDCLDSCLLAEIQSGKLVPLTMAQMSCRAFFGHGFRAGQSLKKGDIEVLSTRNSVSDE
ncbi:MAG: hypothetical protein V2A73_03900 [Pseudomonadota bacterium]